MAKNKEKIAAHHYFVKEGLEQKEISLKTGVSENTISKWVRDGHWKEERAARMQSSKERLQEIKDLILDLTRQNTDINKEIQEAADSNDLNKSILLKKARAATTQEIAILTKALEKIEKSTRVSLATYLEVMESVFKALSIYDNKLYLDSLDFQEAHIRQITEKLA